MKRLLLLAATLSLAQAPTSPVRPLYPTTVIRDSLAGGGKAVFSIDVPAGSAARIVVGQEGIDVGVTLRHAGSSLPEHGLDMTAGVTGEEPVFPPILDAPATWHIFVAAALPRAERGDYTISAEIVPATDRDRAVAAARQQHQQASDLGWMGDGKSFQQAQDGYAAAAAAAQAAGDAPLAAEATYQCARIHDNLGDQLGAIEWQRRALVMFRAIGRRDRESRVLNRLGDLSRKVGEVADAERYFQEALPAAREARDPAAIADILNNSGLLTSFFGRFEEAIDQLQAAIPLAQEINSANVEGALLANIAEAYQRLGQYEKSIEMYRRAGDVVARLNLPRRSARTQDLLAQVYFEAGDTAKARTAVETSLALYEKAADRTGQAAALGLSARMLHASGEDDAALALFARALPTLHEARSLASEASLLTAWAEVQIDRGETGPAIEKLDQAVELCRRIADRAGESKALYTRALAMQRAGRPDEAFRSVAAAIDIVETTRGAILRSDLRTSYLAAVAGYFDLSVDLLQQQGMPAAAFEMSERGRARTLLEGLAESGAKIHKGVDADLLARQRAVQAQVNAKENYRAQLAQQLGETNPRAAAAARDIEGLLQQLTDVQAKIRAVSPLYWALQKPEPARVDRVQQTLLDAGSALVEYHLGRTRSYVWVIDRGSIASYELPAAGAIDALARRYHERLSRDAGAVTAADREKAAADTAVVGRRLAAAVWKPVESRVRGKRLLIVADGALQYVPFAALPASSGGPLLASHEIVYLPSASVLETLRRESRPVTAGAAAAVFADPVFSTNDPRLAAGRDATAPAATRASDGGVYGRLRFSRGEAEAIAAVSPGAFEALDFSAAKSTLTGSDLRKYRILHFATHGSLNATHPELSGLVFSLVDRHGKPIDGFLRLHEIYNLDLDADLVVLSACRTALGKEVHGEGLIGLTRGFMYAGASRVVSSVWNVDDRASGLLMSRFYTAMLSKGLPPAAALRDAQLSLLREPRWANPHYWAAFGLQGEWK